MWPTDHAQSQSLYPNQLITPTHAHAHIQGPRADLSARPMCTISKEVFRSHPSSMNTDSEDISGVNGANTFFHLCAQRYFLV